MYSLSKAGKTCPSDWSPTFALSFERRCSVIVKADTLQTMPAYPVLRNALCEVLPNATCTLIQLAHTLPLCLHLWIFRGLADLPDPSAAQSSSGSTHWEDPRATSPGRMTLHHWRRKLWEGMFYDTRKEAKMDLNSNFCDRNPNSRVGTHLDHMSFAFPLWVILFSKNWLRSGLKSSSSRGIVCWRQW